SGRVLRELGETKSSEGRTVLAAAVIDDVIGLILLALVSALVHGGARSADVGLGGVTLRAIGFLVGAVAFGRLILPRLFALAGAVAGEGALLVFGLAVALGYGFVASLAGLAPMIGAFTAGLVIQPEDYRALARRPGEVLEDLIAPLLAFFVPTFFLLAGLKVEVAAFLDVRVWLLSLVFVAAAVLGKLAAGLGAGRGISRMAVGVSMIPRGEVSLIFATAGVGLLDGGAPLISSRVFNAIVVTVVVTALLPALWLPRVFARRSAGAEVRVT
ncbi:MAG TPA: cation:proton antiporter, partial [Byssovorax sp.]